jgi:hypothetical protein
VSRVLTEGQAARQAKRVRDGAAVEVMDPEDAARLMRAVEDPKKRRLLARQHG